MGNTANRASLDRGGSFRENSKQHREYKALENKIKLLKIQAHNYSGIGKDNIYSDLFKNIQDTTDTIQYLKGKVKNTNKKLEYDMLNSELQSCLKILSGKIHNDNYQPTPTNQNTNDLAEWKTLEIIELNIKQLKKDVDEESNKQNMYKLNQMEAVGRSLYQETETILLHGNVNLSNKKAFCLNNLQGILAQISTAQTDLHRQSKYDNLETDSPPTDPNLQLLLKMEKALSVYRDKTYLDDPKCDRNKCIETLTYFRKDLHSINLTSKDVIRKQNVLVKFVEETIDMLSKKILPIAVTDHAGPSRQPSRNVDTTLQRILEELNNIELFARNTSDEEHLRYIYEVLQQTNYSIAHVNHQHRPNSLMDTRMLSNLSKSVDAGLSRNGNSLTRRQSIEDHRKSAAKMSLEAALERKGYRKTFLANTMIKQHVGDLKSRLRKTSENEDSEIYNSIGSSKNTPSRHGSLAEVDNSYQPFMRPEAPSSVVMVESRRSSSARNSMNLGSTPKSYTPVGDRKNSHHVRNQGLQEITEIRLEIEQLKQSVGGFLASHHSDEYENLEGRLLDILVRLEHVQNTYGDEVSERLVYAVRDAQRLLTELDRKAAKYNKIHYG